MAIAFFLVGLLLIITGARGTAAQLYSQLWSDITGGFIYWLIAIVALGLLGNIPKLRGFSTAFLTLVLIVLLLKEKGAIQNFEATFHIQPKQG